MATDALLRSCTIQRTRGRGPGGQHRNKVETAVRLVHLPTGVVATATERRSQDQNRRAALFRLRVKLALKSRCPAEVDQTPSERWQSHLRGRTLSVNRHHNDFPTLLAEALDVITAHAMDVKGAAESLKCSTTQLVGFLKIEPDALIWVNTQRIERQLHPIH